MKALYRKEILLTMLLLIFIITVNGQTPIKVSPSIIYFRDLSDTYGGGGLLSGELKAIKSWFGFELGFGHFQSQSTFKLSIEVPEANLSLSVPIHEMSLMQIISTSIFVRPIEKKWITIDVLFGICYNRSKCLFFKDLVYTYDTNEKKFTELITDYQLVNKNRLGYQLGLDFSFYIFQNVGLQSSVKLQDLSRGGSFFFIGEGLCFTF